MPIWLVLASIECQRVLRQQWLWNHRVAYGAFTIALLGASVLWQESRINATPEIARRFFDWWKVFHAVSCYVWMSILTQAAFSGERERASLECVKATTANGFHIVIARFFSRLWAFLVLIAPAFPIVAVGYAMRSIETIEIAIVAYWTVTTCIYVGAIAIAFSVSRKSAGAALGSTLLCLSGLSIVPGFSPWQQLMLVDNADWTQSLILLVGASIIPLIIAWLSLRRAGEVMEIPYDLVGIKQPSDENHRALPAIEFAVAFGKFVIVVLLGTLAIPSLGGYAYFLFSFFDDKIVMQILFLFGPCAFIFAATLGYRILASHHLNRRDSTLADLLQTPMPVLACIWHQIRVSNFGLIASSWALIGTSVFCVLACGLPGIVITAMVWIELLTAVWVAISIRLSTESGITATSVACLYLFGIWGLPFCLPPAIDPTEFGATAGYIALGLLFAMLIWNTSGILVAMLVACRHYFLAIASGFTDTNLSSIHNFSPASFAKYQYEYLLSHPSSSLQTGMQLAMSQSLAAAMMCLVAFAWLMLQVDVLLDRPGYRERIFARWLRTRKSRFGFPFPFR